MSELLPCPFCKKGKAYTIKPARYGKSWGVLCECGAFLGYEYTEAEAIARWNSRAERTCHNVSTTNNFMCSECDAADLDFDRPSYCHGCGAKVVGE